MAAANLQALGPVPTFGALAPPLLFFPMVTLSLSSSRQHTAWFAAR
jgi:hypothetical protein